MPQSRTDRQSQLARYHQAVEVRRAQAQVEEIERLYAKAIARIRPELDRIEKRIRDAKAKGEAFSPSWPWQKARLRETLDQLESEIDRYAVQSRIKVEGFKLEAVQRGVKEAKSLMSAQLSFRFGGFPPGVGESIVGNTGGGTPLGNLFATFGPDAAAEVREVIVAGVVSGKNPNVIARGVRDALDVPLSRARTIARTEVIRARRDAMGEMYRANSDVVFGWRWQSAFQSRTCAFCLSQDGKVFPLDEDLDSHPNCRCTQVPITEFDDPPSLNGAQWLEQQPEAVQREILGPTAHELYRAGKVRLDDFAQPTFSSVWGKGGRVRSLREMKRLGIINTADIASAAGRIREVRRALDSVPAEIPVPKKPNIPKAPKPKKEPKRSSARIGPGNQNGSPGAKPPVVEGDVDAIARSVVSPDVTGVNITLFGGVGDRQYVIKSLVDTKTGAVGEHAAKDVADIVGLGHMVPRYFVDEGGRLLDALKRNQVIPNFVNDLVVTELVPNARTANAIEDFGKWVQELPRKDRESILLFDVVCGNSDRHMYNVILGANDVPILIDHERAFGQYGQVFPQHFLGRLDMTDDGRPENFVVRKAQIAPFMENRGKILDVCPIEYREEMARRLDILDRLSEGGGRDVNLDEFVREVYQMSRIRYRY